MSPITSAVIAILIYSLILTITNIYKDNSSYYMIDELDIITGGPVLWVFYFSMPLIRVIVKPIYDKNKNNPYKNKDSAYIKKTVAKIVKIYKKSNRYFNSICFDYKYGDYYNTYFGWDMLLESKARYEKINNRFSSLMRHQHKETLEELLKYFVVSDSEDVKDVTLYKLKEQDDD